MLYKTEEKGFEPLYIKRKGKTRTGGSRIASHTLKEHEDRYKYWADVLVYCEKPKVTLTLIVPKEFL